MNRLLLWMSAKRSGSWAQFRSAVEELHESDLDGVGSDQIDDQVKQSPNLPAHQAVRLSLQRLAHVEFRTDDAERIRWRVVPPSVAFIRSAQGRGVLCGFRSGDLLRDLSGLAGIQLEIVPCQGMPDCVRLLSPTPSALIRAAEALGLTYQQAACSAILSALPNASDRRLWVRSEMPVTPGWSVHRFSRSRLQWLDVPAASARSARSGLFRFNLGYQWMYYVNQDGSSFRVPVQVGKFAVLRGRRDVVRYDSPARTLSFPVQCHPPLLVERALVLCTGMLPRLSKSSGRLEYLDVPQNEASLAAQVLDLELS